MGTTGDYCRYVKASLIPYSGAITIRGIDLSLEQLRVRKPAGWGSGFGVWDLGFGAVGFQELRVEF